MTSKFKGAKKKILRFSLSLGKETTAMFKNRILSQNYSPFSEDFCLGPACFLSSRKIISKFKFDLLSECHKCVSQADCIFFLYV